MNKNYTVPELVHFVSVDEIDAQILPLFTTLKTRLAGMLPSAVIDHIGSTAIPHSLTKGDLDVIVLVNANDFESSKLTLLDHFTVNVGTPDSSEYYSFVCTDYSTDVGIQLVCNNAAWPPFILWRDLLMRNDKVREEYDTLKRRFEGMLMADYRKAKKKLINRYFPDPDD